MRAENHRHMVMCAHQQIQTARDNYRMGRITQDTLHHVHMAMEHVIQQAGMEYKIEHTKEFAKGEQ